MENLEFLHDEIQAQHAGNQLAQQRRPARPRDAHIQRQNKHDVQHHIQKAAHDQENQGRFGISQRPEDARQKIVQHGRGNAQENHENIVVGKGKRIRRGVHPEENLAAQQRRYQRHRRGDDAAKPDHIADEPAQPVKIPLSEFLRHGNGKPGAHAVAQSQHQKRNRTGRADPRQRVHTQKFPHHNGIHHTVNLLKQQSENQRQHKGKYQLHRRPGGQVLRMHICQVCHLIFCFLHSILYRFLCKVNMNFPREFPEKSTFSPAGFCWKFRFPKSRKPPRLHDGRPGRMQYEMIFRYRCSPRKNTAMVPGPEWEPMTAPV